MPKLVPGYRDEVKEKILEVAWNVIMDRGTKETTMDDFAKALNCSKGALYNYFTNKDELLEAAISSGHTKFQELLFARFSSGDFSVNAGRYFDEEILNSFSNVQITLELLLEGIRNEKLARALKVKYDGAVESLAKLFEKLSSSGRITVNGDVISAAKSVYALRTGVLFSLAAGMSEDDAKKVWVDGLSSFVCSVEKSRLKTRRIS